MTPWNSIFKAPPDPLASPPADEKASGVQRGACQCSIKIEGFSEHLCTCEWGDLIRGLRALAYQTPPDQVARLLGGEIMRAVTMLGDQRVRLLGEFAATWAGTSQEFCETFNITKQRLSHLGILVGQGLNPKRQHRQGLDQGQDTGRC